MKSVLWKAILVFSLALNVAVAGTLGWHLWRAQSWLGAAGSTTPSPTFSAKAQQALQAPDAPFSRREMQEKRRLVQEKKGEILNIIAARPGDLAAIQPHLDELMLLQAQMEKAALTRISKIMAQLPQEKRGQFLEALKNRACKGPGMMPGFGPRSPKGRSMRPDPPFEPHQED